MKPTFTLTYGLGYALEMPPVEKSGKQIEVVDASGQQLDALAFLNSRKRAALNGDVYNPEIGFALVGNTGSGLKYPYNPFYGQFSPRIAAAWSPKATDWYFWQHGSSRRIWPPIWPAEWRRSGAGTIARHRLNPTRSVHWRCRQVQGAMAGITTATTSNAFRVGMTGSIILPQATPTLPQPDFPGYNAIAAGAGEGSGPALPSQCDRLF